MSTGEGGKEMETGTLGDKDSERGEDRNTLAAIDPDGRQEVERR